MRTSMVVTLAAAFGISGCAGDMKNSEVEKLIGDAKIKLAPDRRTVVFDVAGTLAGKTLTLTGEVHDAGLKVELLRFVRERGDYIVIDSLTLLPEASLGGNTFGVVSLSVANIRTKPDHAAELATQAILGTPVKVLKRLGEWYYIQTPDQYLGWSDDAIVRLDRDAYATWSGRRKVIVTAEYGWVHQSKEKNSRRVSDVVAGSLLALSGEGGGYYDVVYPDGRTGCLLKEDARPFDAWLAEAKDTPERITSTAQRFFGVPYLWGGTSAKGMDCSGFAKTVYYLNGVLLPRDANQQALVGDPIEIPNGEMNLHAGDLLFFGSRASAGKSERVTHVAISLGGKRFIHESGDVHINSLDPADPAYSEFRFTTFLRAKRIIGAGESSGIRRLATLPYYQSNEP